ncbi:MAG: HIT domain-containing protein [Candidatus Lokiarchaeota archaeon]|nr:HIT domain-containing protein [Candidatus Lokiarchaeota archaeon]MBD3202402.1 HIT domain-containing protein [Candidatus Lokiarchaeota archaeon]
MSDENCIFCKIVNDEIPSKIVFENSTTIAFLDIHPISEGHTIVIPKNHYKTLENLPDNEINTLFQTVRDVASLIYKRLQVGGYNIVQNNHEAAGQVVNHAHIHIIPRNKGDQRFKAKIPKSQASEEELNNVLEKLKS